METVERELSQKIVNILHHGKKKRTEIVSLLSTDASEPTIGNHLEDLVEGYEFVECNKEGRNSIYYLTGKINIKRPKPRADAAEVDRVFCEIERALEGSSSDLGPTTSRDPFLYSIGELLELSLRYRCVLYSPDILRRFFEIFESVIGRVKGATSNTATTQSTRTRRSYDQFFLCAKDLYEGWRVGQEPEEYHERLYNELEEVQEEVQLLPKEFRIQLQELALNVNENLGRQFYRDLVKSNDYNQDTLLEKGFYTYEVNNNLHKLLSDLNDIRGRVTDDGLAKEVDSLIKEIRRLYFRESPEKGGCW